MSDGKKVLLAFGGGTLNQAVYKTLQEAGFQVSVWPAQRHQPPKERYDYLVQLGEEPTALVEGTPRLLEKALKEKAEFFLVSSLRVSLKPTTAKEATYLEALHFAEALTRQFHQKYGLRGFILRLPTIFGPGIPLENSGTLGHLISEFTADQLILTLYGEGKDSDYYLYLTDAAEAVKLALTLKVKEKELYFAAPPTPLSSATIAETLVEMGGGRHEIRYHKGLTSAEEETKLEGEVLPHFKPKVSLKEGILETLKALSAEGTGSPQRGETFLEKILSIHPRRFSFTFPRPNRKRMVQLVILLLIFSPILYVGGRVSLAAYHLTQLYHQIGTFNFPAAHRTAEAIKMDLNSLNRFFGILPFARKTPLRDLQLISQGGSEAVTALAELLSEGETALTTLENLLKSHRGEALKEQTEEEFGRLATAFREVEGYLLASQLHLGAVETPFNRWLTPYLTLLQEGLAAVQLGGAFSAEASELLGYQGERNYLLFFQNSAEVWAGGGAVTSFAQLTLENGGIKNLRFFDHWDFSHVEGVNEAMPEVFVQMGSPEIRPPTNIVISPDFANNAKFFTKVFEEETGVKIEGIIGVDLHFAEELLRITGPLQLPDFENKEITAENLFEVTETEVEKGFFPGSSKKKRFIQALGEGVLARLFGIEQGYYAAISQLVWGGLQEKGILLYFTNPTIYQTAIESGFAGLVEETTGDYLFPLDHNTGTKGTVWVKREISYKIFNSDREGTMRGELTISWRNEGTNSWPAGNYNNIFRVLVPKGSKLVKANLGDEDATSKIISTEELGKGEFAIALVIKPQTTETLKILYDLPFNLDELLPYQLLVQKQPGIVGDSFTFTFEAPFGKQLSGAVYLPARENLQIVDSHLIFKKGLDQDITLEVAIEEKEE